MGCCYCRFLVVGSGVLRVENGWGGGDPRRSNTYLFGLFRQTSAPLGCRSVLIWSLYHLVTFLLIQKTNQNVGQGHFPLHRIRSIQYFFSARILIAFCHVHLMQWLFHRSKLLHWIWLFHWNLRLEWLFEFRRVGRGQLLLLIFVEVIMVVVWGCLVIDRDITLEGVAQNARSVRRLKVFGSRLLSRL